MNRDSARSHSMSNARAGLTEPAHGVVDAAGTEPLLGEQEAVALVADQVLDGHADVLVEDLGVPAGLAGAVIGLAHRRHVAQDVHARRVASAR